MIKQKETMEKKKTYAEAIQQLESIVRQIEDNTLDIDSLGQKVKEAQKLILFCRDKLYKTDEELKKILNSDEK